tara:strand:- start:8409 stop:10043 length:1635 start_codon:yes stop_codon:yes gene_type:complete
MKTNKLILVLSVLFLIASCSRKTSYDKSSTTGWEYNNTKNGGFETNQTFVEQATGPGLVFIEGGSFTMGRVEQDVMYEWDNIPRKQSVSSFYLDEVEVRNQDYLEYLFWIKTRYQTYPEVYKKNLPDTLVWRDKLGYNEPFVNQYLRHPAYKNYPVVGVSWEQARDYCSWRTDRVNERILIDACIIKENTEQYDEDVFTTDAYLNGQYEGIVIENKKDLKNESYGGEGTRIVRLEDGLILPNYRLPTEAEWEFAALGYVGNTIEGEENMSDRRIYPWDGASLRNPSHKNSGAIMANFKRGRGDNMGVTGNLNDNADIPTEVKSYWPNDYGLYNMAGNVSEWVMDVYRPVIEQTTTADHRSFRGNVFKTQERDADGFIAEKDELGRIKMVKVEREDNTYRRNYKKADNINYLSGDVESQATNNWYDELNENSETDKANVLIDKWSKLDGGEKGISKYKDNAPEGNSNEMYAYGETSLITDRTRIFKGGSWKDRAYWLNPGTRRFLDQSQATDAIGFRCAMDRVGSPTSRAKKNQRTNTDYSKKRR